MKLKSTYNPLAGLAPLPEGWTEHKAPDGRPYYYNDTTKQSTYIRPARPPPPAGPPSLPQASDGASIPHYDVYGVSRSSTVNGGASHPGSHWLSQRDRHGARNRSDEGHTYRQRHQPIDRPERKFEIPDCPPWLLVQTKLGRRFVHNIESGESFWRFPSEVTKAVIEFDRLEREKRIAKAEDKRDDPREANQASATAREQAPTALAAPSELSQDPKKSLIDSDGEEYEEVEVTDDEDENHRAKRQKTDEGAADHPVEFNEDDIAYQLAAMGEDYGLDPGEYGNGGGEDLEEGAEGLGLSEEDSKALFKDMLSDYQISPYTTWDKIIEAGHIIEDDRYTVLSNMRSRKEVWDEWSRDTIQLLKDQREKEEKKDPRIPYFAFLQSRATPKLYWPEFKRKYKKEPEIHSTKISDRDREKWYREYISRLKLPESTLKADLVKLLKETPLHTLNQSTTTDSLPPSILTDLRYISLRKAIRDPLIEAHISTLPPAPADLSSSGEVDSQARNERERRERALAERQAQVQEEKKRQRGVLQYSRGVLREGEEELRRAMKVGKEGLLGYMNGDDTGQR